MRLAPGTATAVVALVATAVLGTSSAVVAVGFPADEPALEVEALATTDLLPEPVEPAAEPAPVEDVAPEPPAVEAPAVAPLGALRQTDLVVTLPASVTPEQVARLQALSAVEAVDVADAGTVTVGGRSARVVGVDPSSFRSFTPKETASSDALWQAVARGDVAPSYSLAEQADLPLGGDVVLEGASTVSGRVGAVAAFGLPGVDVVVDRAKARELGAVPGTAVLVSAPGREIIALRNAVRDVLGRDAEFEVLRVQQVAPPAGKPTSYRELYIDSARYCPGLSWTILASIGQIESGHGRNMGPSSAGALGPMQFMPATWAYYGVDGDGDGKADVMNPFDAVPAAAIYLCKHGAQRGEQGMYDALFAYNRADWYVRKVLALADAYAQQG